jgi:hypothetical protein
LMAYKRKTFSLQSINNEIGEMKKRRREEKEIDLELEDDQDSDYSDIDEQESLGMIHILNY